MGQKASVSLIPIKAPVFIGSSFFDITTMTNSSRSTRSSKKDDPSSEAQAAAEATATNMTASDPSTAKRDATEAELAGTVVTATKSPKKKNKKDTGAPPKGPEANTIVHASTNKPDSSTASNVTKAVNTGNTKTSTGTTQSTGTETATASAKIANDTTKNFIGPVEATATGANAGTSNSADKPVDKNDEDGKPSSAPAQQPRADAPVPDPVTSKASNPSVLRKTPVAPDDFFVFAEGNGLTRADAFQRNAEFKLKPYNGKRGKGIGMDMPLIFDEETVVIVPSGGRAFMNEKSNRMGKKLIGLTLYHAGQIKKNFVPTPKNQINRVGESKPFEVAYHELQLEVHTLAGYTVTNESELDHTRRRGFYWKVLCGFNTVDSCNLELRSICILYAEYRVGIQCSETGTELTAMNLAIDHHYRAYRDDIKDSFGDGSAFLLMIHMINDHMAMENVTPVVLYPDEDSDEEIGTKLRREQTKDVWVGTQLYRLESRESVRKELLDYLVRMGKDISGSIDKGDDPPAAAKTPAIKSGKRRVYTD